MARAVCARRAFCAGCDGRRPLEVFRCGAPRSVRRERAHAREIAHAAEHDLGAAVQHHHRYFALCRDRRRRL